MHGEWNAWHDNGLLRQKITYRDGTLDGPFEAYYGSGGRLSQGNYLEGAEEGSWKFYLEDGRLQHIHRYRAGNLIETIRVNGTFTTWYGEERPESEVNYRDKKLDGPFREWHDQGGFVLETFTDADTGEPLQRRVMQGVQVSREGEYVAGQLDGPVYHYSSTGQLTHTEHYNMGSLEQTETH
jgi:antitoxin component YwqK of YwqJK toxin-antitoxin module